MDFDINSAWTAVYSNTAFLLLYLVVLIVGKRVYDLMTPFSIDEQIIEKKNLAMATSYFGYTLAMSIIFVGSLLGPAEGLLADLLKVGGYSAMGIVLLNVSRIINNKLILSKFNNTKEIIDDQNVGTGAVQAGSYIASALIIGASIHGEGGGIETALVFFVLCQLALVIMTRIYNLITPFCIHDEIEKDNFAAGIAFSGSLIAVGIILVKGAAGDFESWQSNLLQLAHYSLIAFVVLPIFRFVLDKLIIWGIDLNKEISEHQNVGAAVLEFGGTIGFSVVLYFLI
ncbi:MAG: DUF350 domain-containing protein [Psychrosphaera sp.]|nr:DUF350 domain-containing protein [Psychrosphaera sp.]